MAPGLILAYIEPSGKAQDSDINDLSDKIRAALHGVTAVTRLRATDEIEGEKIYRHHILFELDDIDKVSPELIQSARKLEEGVVEQSDWILFSQISFDHPDSLTGFERPVGKKVVQVGMAPRDEPEVIKDYHAWYKEEHMPRLATVKGWRAGFRYHFLSRHGAGAEPVRPFLAMHIYDEENGLGGAAWKSSIDHPWTKRVQSNVTQPNHRRTWEIVS